eukprot:3697452-Pleurochrysis_carterae.AAC.1
MHAKRTRQARTHAKCTHQAHARTRSACTATHLVVGEVDDRDRRLLVELILIDLCRQLHRLADLLLELALNRQLTAPHARTHASSMYALPAGTPSARNKHARTQ